MAGVTEMISKFTDAVFHIFLVIVMVCVAAFAVAGTYMVLREMF